MKNSLLKEQEPKLFGKTPAKEGVINVFSFLVPSVLPGLLAIYATSLYSRHFTPAEYGHYSLVLAIAAPVLVIASQWLAQATTRFYHELVAQSEVHVIGDVISTANSVVTFLVLVLALIVYRVGVIYNLDTLPFLSGFAYLLTSIIVTNIASYMIYSGKHHVYNLTMTLASFAAFIFTLALAYHTDIGISSLLIGVSLSNICVIVILYRVAKITILSGGLSEKSKTTFKKFIGYGIPLSFWMLMYSVINISDRYIIQFFLGSSEVGKYSIHYSLASLPFLAINSPIINIYSPKIMKAASENDDLKVREYIRQATGIYAIIGWLAMGLAYRFGSSVPYVIVGHSYYLDKSFYLYIIAGFTIWSASMFWHKPMEIAKNTKAMLSYVSIAAAINVMLNIILVPLYGLNAAALSTLIAFCFYSLLVFLSVRKTVGLSVDAGQLAVCVFAAVAMVFITYLAPIKVIDTGVLGGAVAGIIIFTVGYLVIYLAITTLFAYIRERSRNLKGKSYV